MEQYCPVCFLDLPGPSWAAYPPLSRCWRLWCAQKDSQAGCAVMAVRRGVCCRGPGRGGASLGTGESRTMETGANQVSRKWYRTPVFFLRGNEVRLDETGVRPSDSGARPEGAGPSLHSPAGSRRALRVRSCARAPSPVALRTVCACPWGCLDSDHS